MTDDELRLLWDGGTHAFPPVHVQAGDYDYDGWLVAIFIKRKSGKLRCNVEDDCGRLFIHNASQLSRRNE